MTPRVTHLHCKIGRRKKMEARTCLEIVANEGIAGDASFGRRNRQILLVDGDIIEEFNLDPGDLRENIIIEGLAVDTLPPETKLLIGNVSLSVTGPCTPCGQLDEFREGLRDALQGRRGALARALSDGQISVGDRVEVIFP